MYIALLYLTPKSQAARKISMTKYFTVLFISTFGTKYSMDQVKFFKGCLPQILLGPFLKNLSYVMVIKPFTCF